MKKVVFLILCIIEIILVSLLIWVGLTSFNDDFKNIVHRGYSRRIVENTLESVKESIKESYNGVEIDARKTSDGVIVLSHEKKITGTIDGKEVTYNISKTPYEKLKKLLLMEDSEYGEIYISTLEDVLKFASESSIILAIHCKNNEPEFLEQVASMVVENNMSGKVLYSGVKDYETQISVIKSIDKNAVFCLSYNYLFEENKTIIDLLDKDKLIITIKSELVNKEVIRNIRKSGRLFYIYDVDKDNFKIMKSYRPNYIEYKETVRLSELKK